MVSEVPQYPFSASEFARVGYFETKGVCQSVHGREQEADIDRLAQSRVAYAGSPRQSYILRADGFWSERQLFQERKRPANLCANGRRPPIRQHRLDGSAVSQSQGLHRDRGVAGHSIAAAVQVRNV